MLTMDIVLHPKGDTARSRVLHRIAIHNVTADKTRQSDDYAWRIAASDAAGAVPSRPAMGWLVDVSEPNAIDLLGRIIALWRSGQEVNADCHGRRRLPEGQSSSEDYWSRIDARRPEFILAVDAESSRSPR